MLVEGGAEDDGGRAVERGQVARGLQAVHHRHRDVHQHGVHGQLLGLFDGFAAIARLAGDLVPAQLAHQRGEALAGQGFVVDEQELHGAEYAAAAAAQPARKRVSSQSPRSRTSSAQTLCGIG